MSKEFKPGNTYVFSTKKFRKVCTEKDYRRFRVWVDKCNGREVYINSEDWGRVGRYGVHCDWCKCIKKSVK